MESIRAYDSIDMMRGHLPDNLPNLSKAVSVLTIPQSNAAEEMAVPLIREIEMEI